MCPLENASRVSFYVRIFGGLLCKALQPAQECTRCQTLEQQIASCITYVAIIRKLLEERVVLVSVTFSTKCKPCIFYMCTFGASLCKALQPAEEFIRLVFNACTFSSESNIHFYIYIVLLLSLRAEPTDDGKTLLMLDTIESTLHFNSEDAAQ